MLSLQRTLFASNEAIPLCCSWAYLVQIEYGLLTISSNVFNVFEQNDKMTKHLNSFNGFSWPNSIQTKPSILELLSMARKAQLIMNCLAYIFISRIQSTSIFTTSMNRLPFGTFCVCFTITGFLFLLFCYSSRKMPNASILLWQWSKICSSPLIVNLLECTF